MHLDTNNPISLEDLITKINEKWPSTVYSDWAKIRIVTREIQTDCIGFDRYDPLDWTNFIIIRKV